MASIVAAKVNGTSNGPNHDSSVKGVSELAAFDGVFATLQEDLASVFPGNVDIGDAITWFKTVNEYNVPFGKKNRGMAVVEIYRHLVADASEDNINKARILGWCIEWLQAFFLVADDIMDHSLTRRGKPCWYKRDEVGLIAVNDCLYLESAIYVILKKYFRQSPSYTPLMELFHEVTLQTVCGQTLDLLTSPASGVDFSRFTTERHKAIVEWKTSYYSFYLPFACAMYLAGIFDESLHSSAKAILLRLGEYFQIQDDYLDCYGDPEITGKIGTDIEDNKCSWLIVQALARANSTQRSVLEASYARHNADDVAKVKAVYAELGLEQAYRDYEESSYRDLMTLIGSLTSDALPKDMFISFAGKFYKRNK